MPIEAVAACLHECKRALRARLLHEGAYDDEPEPSAKTWPEGHAFPTDMQEHLAKGWQSNYWDNIAKSK